MFEFLSGTISALLTGYFFLLLDGLKAQRELTSVLIALAKECEYNSIYRGNSRCPFQNIWMERALTMQSFYEQMGPTVEKCIDIFELAKDANADNIDQRGVRSSTIQETYKGISADIQGHLPHLRKRSSTLLNYFLFTLKTESQRALPVTSSLQTNLD